MPINGIYWVLHVHVYIYVTMCACMWVRVLIFCIGKKPAVGFI